MREISGPPSTWYDPPRGHEPECICHSCHASHREWSLVPENAEEGYECCQEEVHDWIAAGEYCETHGGSYMEEKECLKCKAADMYRRAVGW